MEELDDFDGDWMFVNDDGSCTELRPVDDELEQQGDEDAVRAPAGVRSPAFAPSALRSLLCPRTPTTPPPAHTLQRPGKRSRPPESPKDSLEAAALLRSLADVFSHPQADSVRRADKSYRCRRCMQPKKGHTCPVRSTLKDMLWGRGGAASAGSPLGPLPGDHAAMMAGAFLPSRDGDGDGAGGPSLGHKRQHLITKLMQRIERRLAVPVNFTPCQGDSIHCTDSCAS